jgi:UDP-N-acetylglucosamine--N-acetylmuramyl-(pentapeptide) pyrophosphoryl-undecaprenol N-acetylglucosamine transferase
VTLDVLLVGGGTAGHVLPALATASALAEVRPELRLGFAGLSDSIEERLVAAAGFDFEVIRAVRLPRRLGRDLLRVPGALLSATGEARKLLRREQVRILVSFGGYVGMPLVLAARKRVPLLLHEQNSVPGLANRISARWAAEVALTFPSSESAFGSHVRRRFVGAPVRRAIVELDRSARRSEACASFGLDPARRTVLVFGGSLGARSLNLALTGALAAWRELDVQILHLTGTRGFAESREAWHRAGLDPDEQGSGVRVLAYLEDMTDAYAAADLVVCRAGATSIAELTVLGLPAVLIPYPHATADHQRSNAAALEGIGAAVVLADEDLDAASLTASVRGLLADPQRLAAMGAAAAAWARPQAAYGLAALIVTTLEGGGP